MEESSPAHAAGMNQDAEIGAKALADVAGLPDFIWCFHGHVNEKGSANEIGAGDVAPEAAVVGIVAVVSHDKIFVRRNMEWAGIFLRGRWIRERIQVRFVQLFSVDENNAAPDLDSIAGHSDHTLDEIFIVGGLRRSFKDDDLLAFGVAPERDVVFGERNSDVVADQGNDEVIANENRVFHRGAGDDARLDDHGFNDEESQNHPEPRDQLAAQAIARGGFGFLRL